MTLLCEKLGHTPSEVDYLNISVKEDMLQFVDPNLIDLVSERETGKIGALAKQAKKQIDNFFERIFEVYRDDLANGEKRKEFMGLFSHFSEPHHIGLGFSQEGNTGKGTTAKEFVDIFMNRDIISIILNEDGLSIPQKTPLIKSFGDDKLSDLTTNIIMNVIIEFNRHLIKLYPELQSYQTEESEKYYYYSDGSWKEDEFQPFLFDNRKTLLIPKLFTTYNQTSSLDLIIRVYIVEEIDKLQKENSTSKRMTKKEYTKTYISGNRIDNITKIFLNTSQRSHEKFKSELRLKSNYRRKKHKED
ncbi:hypothetical protein [Staphylococcus simulans]|uniref:hypothetical protein n=1 Tax=Staphylococcus simulans TaxID=1286 RepID=UPI0021D3D923|nr:hypothetical protein [Staphylococcus simulans]UXV37660.1 hypothetical protein MUA87_00555 [Staphylococcus simulans]UXV40108.1 hypothetical protein MUA56_00555 [Staphylococcus simulans]